MTGSGHRALVAALLIGLPVAPAAAHDWFSDLVNRYGHPCCNGEDCGRTVLCRLLDDREGIVVAGQCRPIPWDKVLDLPSPDAAAYVCAGGLEERWRTLPPEATLPPQIVCVILPGSA